MQQSLQKHILRVPRKFKKSFMKEVLDFVKKKLNLIKSDKKMKKVINLLNKTFLKLPQNL